MDCLDKESDNVMAIWETSTNDVIAEAKREGQGRWLGEVSMLRLRNEIKVVKIEKDSLDNC